MKVYVINGPEGIGKTDFSVNLAEYLQTNSKVLLLQGKRNARSNIEDYFQKDGMITYDVADYFQGLAPLSMALVKESANLDFMISPLLEDKYSYNNEDMNKLLSEVNYDYIVIDGASKNIVPNSTEVTIVSSDMLGNSIDSDAFFVNKVSDTFDIREHKSIVDSSKASFLGTVKEGEYFSDVIKNLVNENQVEVQKIGFFERLTSGFRK